MREDLLMNGSDLINVGAFIAVASVALALVWWVGFIPYRVARDRGHPNTTPIFIICLFFGWTLVGWVIALVWATVALPPPTVRTVTRKMGALNDKQRAVLADD
jgi:hypothetical protein